MEIKNTDQEEIFYKIPNAHFSSTAMCINKNLSIPK